MQSKSFTQTFQACVPFAVSLLVVFILILVSELPLTTQAAPLSAPAPTFTAVSPSEAYNFHPTRITIIGTGFFTITGSFPLVPQVTLDNVLLPNITFASSTTLTATVPAGFPSGTYTLTIKNPDNQSANLPSAFTVLQTSDGNLVSWKLMTAMTKNRYGLAAVAANGYVYALGGQSPAYDNSVERATINTDGSLGPWQVVSDMITPRAYFAAVATDGYIYAIGGGDGNTALASVERAVTNPDGSLGPWQTLSVMSMSRLAPAAVAMGGYLYVIGGGRDWWSNSMERDSVERAAINADGSLGPWQLASSMTTARGWLGAVVVGRYIYAIGGQGGGSASLNSVERAEINSDGALGTWEAVNPMATARCNMSAIAVDGYIYAIGGGSCIGGALYKSVERAQVNFDGSLTSWETMPAMITSRVQFASVQEKHNVYVVGGLDESNTTLSSVEQAAVGFPFLNNFSPSAIRSDQVTSVTIKGTNILPSPSLLLGESYLDVNFVSTTTLTTTISSGLANGWYAATLTSGDGRIASLAHAVRVDGPGPVVVGDYGLTINDGALFTNKITVTLTIGSRSDTALMQVSNDGGFAGVQWEIYTSHKTWQITQYGNYVIPRVAYVRFKDINGNISATFQDDIILDVTAPTGTVQIVTSTWGSSFHIVGVKTAAAPLGVGVFNGYSYTVYLPLVLNNFFCPPTGPANVTLGLSAQDDVSGLADMMISNVASFNCATWEPYATTKAWYVPQGATTTVYVKFRDNAGNVSEVVTDTVTMPPQ